LPLVALVGLGHRLHTILPAMDRELDVRPRAALERHGPAAVDHPGRPAVASTTAADVGHGTCSASERQWTDDDATLAGAAPAVAPSHAASIGRAAGLALLTAMLLIPRGQAPAHAPSVRSRAPPHATRRG
jgi:hypothetical protein